MSSPEYRPDYFLPLPRQKTDKELKKIWSKLAERCDEYNIEEPPESIYLIEAEYPLVDLEPFKALFWYN